MYEGIDTCVGVPCSNRLDVAGDRRAWMDSPGNLLDRIYCLLYAMRCEIIHKARTFNPHSLR